MPRLRRYRFAAGKLEFVAKMPGSLPSFGLSGEPLEGLAFLSIGLDGAPLIARDQGAHPRFMQRSGRTDAVL
jgi:hypothetical protein